MILAISESVKNVHDLLSEKSENVFHKETKPHRSESGGVCVCIQPVLSRTHQGIHECDAE